MSDWLMRVMRDEAKNLIALAADDDELRAGLRALANEILAATEDPGIETAAAHVEADRSPAVEPAGSDGDKTDIVEPLRKLTLGMTVRSKTEARAESTSIARVCGTQSELAELETNCRGKAEAARWATERLLGIRGGE